MTNDELQKLKDKICNPIMIILNTSLEEKTLKEIDRIINYINSIEPNEK